MERKVGLRSALWMLGQVWYDGPGRPVVSRLRGNDGEGCLAA